MPLAAKMTPDATPAEAPAVPPVLRLFSRQVPPGGLSYRIKQLTEKAPRESLVGPYNALEMVYNEVRKRCLANGIAPPSPLDVENDICQRLPPGHCRDSRNRKTTHPGQLALSLSDVVTGTIALLRWVFNGSVPDDQIIARTYVCNGCPENLPISGCQGCAGSKLRSLINKIVAKPLPSDAVLGACGACKCSLPAKTRMKLDDVQKSMDTEKRAKLWENCWILKEEAGEPLRNDPRT